MTHSSHGCKWNDRNSMKEIRGEEKIATKITAELIEPLLPRTNPSMRLRESAIGRSELKNAALLLRIRNVDADTQHYSPRAHSVRFVAPRRTNPLAPPSGTTTALDTKITRRTGSRLGEASKENRYIGRRYDYASDSGGFRWAP